MEVIIEKVSYALKQPFAITGYTFTETKAVKVTLIDGQHIGHGEGVGVYYMNESQESMFEQLMGVKSDLESTSIIDNTVSQILPPGGAKNALDCAIWDLTAKRSGKSIYSLLNTQARPLRTVFTIGVGSIDEMSNTASENKQFPILKVKLDANKPIEKLEAIRQRRPDAKIIVDVNQAWSFLELQEYLSYCKRLNISMIEQPLPRGHDEQLDGFNSSVPLGADESCLHEREFDIAAQRYDVINIKLDKCGGLTSALKLVELARSRNKVIMVGNMVGSSLSMAPAHVIGQFSEFIDLDGPLLLAQDSTPKMHYSPDGLVYPPSSSIWG